MAKRHPQKSSFGFTTIELLIVIVVIIILGALIIITYNGVQQRNHDTDRKTDIIKIEGQIEAYQAETNQYPSVAQLNSSSFRSANMKELDASALADPLWKSSNTFCSNNGTAQLEGSATPHTGCYGYDPSPANCDNKNVDCTSYILTANLETGGVYTKESIR